MSSVVVSGPAHIAGAEVPGVSGLIGLAAAQRCCLHALLEHGLDGLVARGVDLEGLLAGALKPGFTVLVCQAQEAEGGAIPLLGVRLVADHVLNQGRRLRPPVAP